jgi:predicted O-methyltransferase YrrM
MFKNTYKTHDNYLDHKDSFLIQKLEEIVDKYGITTIVETGVDRGDSTVYFAQMVDNVISIEINPRSIDITAERLRLLDINNVELVKGNSSSVLLTLMHKIDVNKTLFFLDAHWGAYWPLIDEIDAISRNKGILVIHDAQVPNHPELGFDTWNGNALNYDYIKNALTNWSKNHRVEYNEFSSTARGCMFVYPN